MKDKKIIETKESLIEQIEFLESMLASLEDAKYGRVSKFEFSKYE